MCPRGQGRPRGLHLCHLGTKYPKANPQIGQKFKWTKFRIEPNSEWAHEILSVHAFVFRDFVQDPTCGRVGLCAKKL